MGVAVAYAEQRSFDDMHAQLVEYASSRGVAPEVALAVRARYWPACFLFEFAIAVGLNLPALLEQLDRFIEYV